MIKRSAFFTFLLFVLPFTQSFLTGQKTGEEYGVASYYGDEFHGRKTASGERYSKNEMTCAHKTLPFGSKIRVTRLDNKKSVVVRVNDRGPFIKGYVVDLSRKAAAEIGMLDEGVVKVKIEVIEKSDGKKSKTGDEAPKPEERSTPTDDKKEAEKPASETKKQEKSKEESSGKASSGSGELVTGKNFKTYDLYAVELRRPSGSGYGVQVATLSNFENLFSEIAKLQGSWGSKVLVSVESAGESPVYKLILGPFSDKKTAEKNQKSAAKKGYKKCFVVELE